MKTRFITCAVLGLLAAGIAHTQISQAQPGAPRYEYVSVRWDGQQYSHVIRPDGTVQYSRDLLGPIDVPLHTDDAAYIRNRLINLLGKDGYEVVGQNEQEITLKRQVYP